MVVAANFVLDASVTVPWVFRDEKCVKADRAWSALVNEKATAHVPGIWSLEVVNVPMLGPKKSDRPKPSRSDIELFFSVLRNMPVRTHHQSLEVFIDQAVPLMDRYAKLTSYDAAYILLAKHAQLPLITRDELMAKVAVAEGIEVLV